MLVRKSTYCIYQYILSSKMSFLSLFIEQGIAFLLCKAWLCVLWFVYVCVFVPCEVWEIPGGVSGLCSVYFQHMGISMVAVSSQQASAFTWLYYLLNIFSSRFFPSALEKGGSGMWPFLCLGVKWWLLMLSALNTCLAQCRSPSPPKGLVTIKLLPKSVPESGLRGLGKRRDCGYVYDLALLSFFLLLFCLSTCVRVPMCILMQDIQSMASRSFSHRWIFARDVAQLTRFCPRQEVPC